MPAVAGGATWVEVRTARFVITTDAGEERGVELARALEEIRDALEATLSGEMGSGASLPVLALARSREFFGLLPEYRPEDQRGTAVAAAYFSGTGSDEIVLRLDAEGVSERSIVYHEIVHSLTRRQWPGLPVWLGEGLAEVWSTATIEDSVLRLGEEHRRHREHLRQQGLAPLRELIRTRERTPRAAAQAVSLYASAWALTHYLVLGGGEAIDGADPAQVWSRLAAYVERCRRFGDPLLAFEETFGPVDETAAAVDAYLASERLPSRTLPLVRTSLVWEGRSLRAAEVEAILGAFLVRRGAFRAARPHLASALAAEPDLLLAVEAMGRLAYAEGDDGLAVSLLSRALEAREDDLTINYLLVATLRLEGSPARSPETAEEVIRRLVSLRPELAPAWIQLAEAYAHSGASGSLVETACRWAVRARPSSPWFRLLLGRAILVGGREEEALTEARRAARLAVVGDDATMANNVCWYGAVGGLAKGVAPACESAVRLAPERGLYRDSRGLVRALKNDLEGALEDFRAFLSSADAGDPVMHSQRQEWIRSLERGQSPFTPELLETLSDLPF